VEVPRFGSSPLGVGVFLRWAGVFPARRVSRCVGICLRLTVG
jgi:hypothetical protein